MKRLMFDTFFIFLLVLSTVFNLVTSVQASSPCEKYFSEFILSSRNNLNLDDLESEFEEIKSDIKVFLNTLNTSELSFEKNIRQLVVYLLKLENFTNRLYILHDNNKSNQLFATFIKNVILQKFDTIENIFLNSKASSLIEEAYIKRYRSNLDFETINRIQKLHASLTSYKNLYSYNNNPNYRKKIFDTKQDLSLPLSFSVLSSSKGSVDSLFNFLRVFRNDINKLIQLERAYVKSETGAINIYDYTFNNITKNSALNSESDYNNLINITFPATVYTINKVLSSQFKDLTKSYYTTGKINISDLKKAYESQKLKKKQELDAIFSTQPYRIKTSNAVYGIFAMLADMYQLVFIVDPNNYYTHNIDNLFTVNVYSKKYSRYLGDIYINIKDISNKYLTTLQPKVLNLERMKLDSNYNIDEKYFSAFINLKNMVSNTNKSNGEFINFDSLFNLVANIHRSVFNLINYHNPSVSESVNKEFNYLLDSYILNVSFSPSSLRYYLKKEDGTSIEADIINSISSLCTTNFMDMFIYEFLSIEEYVFHYNSYFDENTYLDKVRAKMKTLLEIHDYPLYIDPDFEIISEYIYNHKDIGAIDNTLKLVANIEMLNIMKFLANNEYSPESFDKVKTLLLKGGRDFDKTLGKDFEITPFFEIMWEQK